LYVHVGNQAALKYLEDFQKGIIIDSNELTILARDTLTDMIKQSNVIPPPTFPEIGNRSLRYQYHIRNLKALKYSVEEVKTILDNMDKNNQIYGYNICQFPFLHNNEIMKAFNNYKIPSSTAGPIASSHHSTSDSTTLPSSNQILSPVSTASSSTPSSSSSALTSALSSSTLQPSRRSSVNIMNETKNASNYTSALVNTYSGKRIVQNDTNMIDDNSEMNMESYDEMQFQPEVLFPEVKSSSLNGDKLLSTPFSSETSNDANGVLLRTSRRIAQQNQNKRLEELEQKLAERDAQLARALDKKRDSSAVETSDLSDWSEEYLTPTPRTLNRQKKIKKKNSNTAASTGSRSSQNKTSSLSSLSSSLSSSSSSSSFLSSSFPSSFSSPSSSSSSSRSSASTPWTQVTFIIKSQHRHHCT
jgi:DNA-binding transcriptional MerR regulator